MPTSKAAKKKQVEIKKTQKSPAVTKVKTTKVATKPVDEESSSEDSSDDKEPAKPAKPAKQVGKVS